MFLAVIAALALLISWFVCAVTGGGWMHSAMEARGVSAGNVWAWRATAAEQNWWEALNDRRPRDDELAAAAVAANSGRDGAAPSCCTSSALTTSGSSGTLGTSGSAAAPAAAPAVPRVAQCACLQCGDLIPSPKTCGSCKLAAYCSRECQQRHWPRHKPMCARLQAADRERAQRGSSALPPHSGPAAGAAHRQGLVFSRKGYSALLEASRTGRERAAAAAAKGARASGQAAAGSAGSAGSQRPGGDEECEEDEQQEKGDEKRQQQGEGGGRQAGRGPGKAAASAAPAPSSSSTSSPGPGPGPGSADCLLRTPAAPDGSWIWFWPFPPAPALLTPPRPAGILNTGNSCYAASAVQALLATPGLGEYLRSGAHCGGCGAPEPGEAPQGVSSWCPACELSQLAAAAARAPAAPPGGSEANGGDHAPGAGGGGGGGGGGSWSSGGLAGGSIPLVDARGLTRQVHRLGRTLVPGRQEDAHELLMKLLEALAEVQVAEAGGRGLLRGRAAEEVKKAAAAAAAGEAAGPAAPGPWRGDETSLIHHCLGGYLRRATLCNCCGHVSQSHESLLGLEVHLGPRVQSVEGGLQGYFEDEVLDEGNQYRCERCRQLVCATRQVRLEVAPNALALTLKRFTSSGARAAKNTREVRRKGERRECGNGKGGGRRRKEGRLAASAGGAAPWRGLPPPLRYQGRRTSPGRLPSASLPQIKLRLSLDLTPHMAAGALDPCPASYRLYAVVQHLGIMPPGVFGAPPGLSGSGGGGSLHMGHYVAVVRGGDGAWYRCDDDEVIKVSESEVEAITDAYLLFYERSEPHIPVRPPPPPPQLSENEAGAAARVEGAAGVDAADAPDVAGGEGAARGLQAAGEEAAAPPAASSQPAEQTCRRTTAWGAARAEKRPLQQPYGATEAEAAVLPPAPEWACWLAADTAPPPRPTAGRLVVRPHYRLLPPRPAGGAAASASDGSGGGGGLAAQWVLRVQLPGVRSAREVRLAATRPPPRGRGGGGLQREVGRLRVWVGGCYSLDLRLALRGRQGAPGGLELVCEGGGQDEDEENVGGGGSAGAAAAAVEVLVLQPWWRPVSCTLRVPLQLRC
uniref:ubiquitinyl hydrolase 1 n=1 Tax=Yamagishiella unicocca TaxID=51707 RepID=A0A2Z5X892_9CHLO|nr:ubiquitin carboxyl-terminal hydrolase [Yamagishiella unicocca]